MIARSLTRLLSGKGCKIFQRLNPVIKFISSTSSNFDFAQLDNNSYDLSLESNYARNILGSSEVYFKSLAIPLSHKKDLQIDKADYFMKKNWMAMNKAEILENFELLSRYAFKKQESLTDNKFQDIMEIIKKHITDFSDHELLHLLNCLELWCSDIKLFYNYFGNILDNECIRRMPNWSIDNILLINDHFIKLKGMKFSEFIQNSLIRLSPEHMTPANLVQYAFLLKVNQRLPISLHNFEYHLQKHADKLTIEELGIIAMAYFKYETAIKSRSLLLTFIRKLQSNIDSISDITLAAHLKLLRYSIDLKTLNQCTILLRSLVPQVACRTMQTITHIAHMQGKILLHDEELISAILERYEKEIQSARIKDIERIIFTLYTFNYDPKNTPFYSAANDELLSPSRAKEINRYPSSLVYTVLYMLHVNFYPEEALKRVMDPEYVNFISRGNVNNLGREYLFMDYCIQIEHPEYNGPRIRKQLLHFLTKKFGSLSKELKLSNQKTNQASQLSIDVAHSLKQILGSESAIHTDSLLPHFLKPDIVICCDPETNKFVSPAEKLSKIPESTIKYAPNDGKKWYAIVIGVHNIVIRNSFSPTGVLAAKLRHLKCIGYTPILIPYHQWLHLRNKSEKRKYIENFLL